MMLVRKMISVAVIVAAFTLGSQAASAQVGHGYPYGAYPYYPTYTVDQIPYFAQNPPVYYGERMARPYGLSPYPYPGHCMCQHQADSANHAMQEPAKPMRRLVPQPPAAPETVEVSHRMKLRTTVHETFSGRSVKTIHFDR